MGNSAPDKGVIKLRFCPAPLIVTVLWPMAPRAVAVKVSVPAVVPAVRVTATEFVPLVPVVKDAGVKVLELRVWVRATGCEDMPVTAESFSVIV
jgi:hypothetical protein